MILKRFLPRCLRALLVLNLGLFLVSQNDLSASETAGQGELLPVMKVDTHYKLGVYKVSSPDLDWVYSQMYVFTASANLSWQQREHLANFAKLLAYGPSQAYKSGADSAPRVKSVGGFTRLYMEEDGFGILEAVPAEHADIGLWAMNQRLEARARMANHPGWVPNDTPVTYQTGGLPLEIRQTLTPGHPYAHGKYPPAKWQMGTAVAVPKPAEFARSLLTNASTSVVVYGPFEGVNGDFKLKRAFKSSLPKGNRELPIVPSDVGQIRQEDRSEGRFKVKAQFWLKMPGRTLGDETVLTQIPSTAFGVGAPFASATTLGLPDAVMKRDLSVVRSRADAQALAELVGGDLMYQGAVSWFRLETDWVHKNDIAKKEAVLLNKLKMFARKPPSRAEVDRIKINLWRKRLKHIQQPENLVWELAKSAAVGGNVSLWEAETWAIGQISSDTIAAFARQLLSAHRIVVLEGSDGKHG